MLTLIGVAGMAATLATFAFAGVAFAVVVAAGALLAARAQRRRLASRSCDSGEGPVEVEITARS